MTEPRWDSVKRSHAVADDDRGPDSVECSPTSHYPHHLCLLDYSSLGFVCGCGCHDIECFECGGPNGQHYAECHRGTDRENGSER